MAECCWLLVQHKVRPNADCVRAGWLAFFSFIFYMGRDFSPSVLRLPFTGNVADISLFPPVNRDAFVYHFYDYQDPFPPLDFDVLRVS